MSKSTWTVVTDHPAHRTLYTWTDQAGNAKAELWKEDKGWKLSIDSLWEKSLRDLGDTDDERALARASEIVDGLGFRHPERYRERDDPWDR